MFPLNPLTIAIVVVVVLVVLFSVTCIKIVPQAQAAIVERLGERAVIAPAHMRYLRPASVGELAWLNRERSVDYLALIPVYLRAPQAERERARRLGGRA